MNGTVIAGAVVLTFLAAIGSCAIKDHEIQKLNKQISQMQNDLPYQKQEECQRAVSSACIRYADCAVTPIETMQQKLCPTPE